jgi:flagellar biosynthesis protein FlhF
VTLKSFFAGDIKSALSQARQELGPEAMLVQSRKSPPEALHLGQYEVVCAVVPETAAGPADGQSEFLSLRESAPSQPAADVDGLSMQVARIRKQLEKMTATVSRSSVLASGRTLPSAELATIFSELISSDVDPELAHDVLNRIRASGAPGDATRLRYEVAGELEARLRVDPRLGRGSEKPAIVALVGPSGSGKTTTLVKLAARYGLITRRPTQLISMDFCRIAAAEQLRHYAAILGLGFLALETTGALGQALEEHKTKDLILIDMPGYSARDLDTALDLAAFFGKRSDIDVHLVLPASMKPADVCRVVDQFEIFRPAKLLFTKLDETCTFGTILNEAVRTGKPVSFLSSGQQVPEDLEEASKKRILELLLEQAPAPASIAAA